MSRSLNMVQLIGNVVRDPELKYTPTGSAVLTVTVATNRSYRKESGELKEVTEYTDCVMWSKLAETVSTLIHKGSKVYVQGRLHSREYTTSDGQKRKATEVAVDEFTLLDKKEQ